MLSEKTLRELNEIDAANKLQKEYTTLKKGKDLIINGDSSQRYIMRCGKIWYINFDDEYMCEQTLTQILESDEELTCS